jgi:preprotein translocase subunit SecG
MENLQVFLLVLQVVVAVLMIGLVLLQKSDGDSLSGIGGGSGGLNSVISSKSSANFLTKLTMFLVAIFIFNCLVLALISSKINNSNSLQIDKIIEKQNALSPSAIKTESETQNKTN